MVVDEEINVKYADGVCVRVLFLSYKFLIHMKTNTNPIKARHISQPF